jgi:hypothetical protein
MVVASGQLPYEYEWPTPFRISRGEEVGISGVHFEAAQFVMNAEMRKFGASEFYQRFWEVFANEEGEGPSPSGYEPKARGETLDGLVGLVPQIELDQIDTMRAVLHDGLFDSTYSDFLGEYSPDEYARDWIRNVYKNSPSGAFPAETAGGQPSRFLRPVLQDDGSTYVPSVFFSNPRLGLLEEADLHWLGGSGVILDIDVGEVQWNPYPMAMSQLNSNTHNSPDLWRVRVAPFYPNFQKTDGDLISLNGLEEEWWDGLAPTATEVLNYQHVGSGYIRYQGYCIFENTKFIFGDVNTFAGSQEGIFTTSHEMNAVAEGERKLGNSETASGGSLVFLDPVALPTGVYRVAAQNTKALFPSTTVESGIVSQWPEPSINREGYEVFDEAFWVTDWGDNSDGRGSVGPSGLSVVSPWTGDPVWSRRAITDLLGTNFLGSNITWSRRTESLERLGVNMIRRLGQTKAIQTDDPMNPLTGTTMTVDVFTFNDLLTTVSSVEVTLSLTPVIGSFAFTKTLMQAGTENWISGDNQGDNLMWQLDSGLNEIQMWEYNFSDVNYMAYISDGKGGALKKVIYTDPGAGGGIFIKEWDAVTPPDTFSFGTAKNIDISTHIDGTITFSTDAEILELVERTGGTGSSIEDGVYALFRVKTTTVSNKLYIARIEEETTTWSIQALWTIRDLDVDYDISPARGMGMIIMPIN